MLETIPKVEVEEEGEKIEYVPLKKRMLVAIFIEDERRKSLNQTSPFIPQDLVHVDTSEEDQQKWIEEMEGEGVNIIGILDFDFMFVGNKMVGEKIYETPWNEPLGKDWNQLPHLSQGLIGIPPPSSQDLSLVPLQLDQASAALPPLIVKPES